MGRSRRILTGAVGLMAGLAGCAGTSQGLVDRTPGDAHPFSNSRLLTAWRGNTSPSAGPAADERTASTTTPKAETLASAKPGSSKQTSQGLSRYFPGLNRSVGSAREDMLRPVEGDLWADATRARMEERVAQARERERARDLQREAVRASDEPVLPVALQIDPGSEGGRPRVAATPRVNASPVQNATVEEAPAEPAIPDWAEPTASNAPQPFTRQRSEPGVVTTSATLDESSPGSGRLKVERLTSRTASDPVELAQAPPHRGYLSGAAPVPSLDTATPELSLAPDPLKVSEGVDGPMAAVDMAPELPPLAPDALTRNTPEPPAVEPAPPPPPATAPKPAPTRSPRPNTGGAAPEPPPPPLKPAAEPATAPAPKPAPEVLVITPKPANEPPATAPEPAANAETEAVVPTPAAPAPAPQAPTAPPSPVPSNQTPAWATPQAPSALAEQALAPTALFAPSKSRPSSQSAPAPAPGPAYDLPPVPSKVPAKARHAAPLVSPLGEAGLIGPLPRSAAHEESGFPTWWPFTKWKHKPTPQTPAAPGKSLPAAVRALVAPLKTLPKAFSPAHAPAPAPARKTPPGSIVPAVAPAPAPAASGQSPAPAPAPRAARKTLPAAAAPRKALPAPSKAPAAAPAPAASPQLPPSYLYPASYYGGVNSLDMPLANPQRPEPTVPASWYWAPPTDHAGRAVAATSPAAPRRKTLLSRFLAKFQGDDHNHARAQAKGSHCSKPGCFCDCHSAQATPQTDPIPAAVTSPQAPAGQGQAPAPPTAAPRADADADSEAETQAQARGQSPPLPAQSPERDGEDR